MRSMRLLYLLAVAAPAFSATDFAVYTLLAPSTHSFEVAYDTSVTRTGAAYFFNPIRPGSAVSKESAIDLASGREAKAANAAPADTADTAQFLWVKLLHPVAPGAETRIRILRTYVDASSY